MLGFFKKKQLPKLSGEMETLANRLLGPSALAVAIAETVRDYANAVKAGSISYPAHRRKDFKDSSVVAIWYGVRIEALYQMFGFGEADLMLLADPRRQLELLNSFIDERPHLEFPQPRGEQVPDTLQAIWQAYRYLDAVGSEVADRETNRATLKSKGCDILTCFTVCAVELRDLWVAHDLAIKTQTEPLPELPLTIIDILSEDITAKAKSIALTTKFGPHYEGGIECMKSFVRQNGSESDLEAVCALIERVLAAKDPDEVSQVNQKVG